MVIEPVVVRVLRSTVGTGTPYAVSVAAGDEISLGNAGAYLEQALRALPGLQIQNRFNLASGERIAIRGFGARAQFGIRGVRVLVDGIPATLPDGQTALDHLDIPSLGRVEMLRGPGSALYGNAAGGVLHFESRAPAQGGTEVEVRSAAGSNGLRTASGSLSGSAGGVGYRAGVTRYGYDGFRRDPVADDGSTYGRQERTVVNGMVDVAVGSGMLRVVANGLDLAADNAGSLSQTLLDQGDRQAYRFSVLQQTREDIRQGQLGLTWTGPLGALDGEVSTWGIRRDFEGRIPSDVVAFDRNAGGFRALFHGSSRDGGSLITLGGGVEAEFQSDDRRNWENERGERGALSLDQQERVRSTGLFVQARVEPAPNVAVLAGARYDRFTFRAEDRFLTDGTDDTGERAMRAFSPSLGLMVEPTDGLELFGSLATAFETPTTTELANRPEGAGGFNPDLDPTRALTVEGGVRARPGSAWSVEATLFRTDLKNELVPFEVSSSPGRTFYRNAGESSHTGWEVTVEARPSAAITARLAYTRVDARYDDYVLSGTDYEGNRIPGLAPHRVDGWVTLRRADGFLELRGLYQDAIPVTDANDAEAPAGFLGDVRVGLRNTRLAGVDLSPFVAVANVFDRRYDASVVVNAFGGRYFEPGPGRTFQIGVAATWGGRP
ncbi:MAG TPA: TonB-dependent receptor [Longimicrobiales bacterium]|nr:TonB-dependent receptor [Longimicrobiales bacterium]